MTTVVILGGGMIGSAMAMDLAQDSGVRVRVADARADVAERLRAKLGVDAVAADLGDASAIARAVEGADLVMGALPSALGLQTLLTVIELGVPAYVDISFMPEDPLRLSETAASRGVCAVVDCGIAPGMSNMLAGYAAKALSPCIRIDMYVGGLPAERRWPFEYKAGFAPSDVLEEYTRPARLVDNGHVVVRDALSEVELLDFPGIGTLEAFNTDGLRSLVHTLDVPFMREKTLRYPGKAALMRVLRETGFFSTDPIDVGGVSVRPLDLTSTLLFQKWTFAPGEADLTVMLVRAHGEHEGHRIRHEWSLVDRYDPKTDLRSMSRATGFTATSVARLLLAKRFTQPGIHPPETLGADKALLDDVLSQLAARNVRFEHRVDPD